MGNTLTQLFINRTKPNPYDLAFITFSENGEIIWDLGPTNNDNFHIRTHQTKSGITINYGTNDVIINRDVVVHGNITSSSTNENPSILGYIKSVLDQTGLIVKGEVKTKEQSIYGDNTENNQIFFERNGQTLYQLGPNYQCCGADFWLWNPNTGTNVLHFPINQYTLNITGNVYIAGTLKVLYNGFYSTTKSNINITTPPKRDNIANSVKKVEDFLNINLNSNQNSQILFYLFNGNNAPQLMWELGPNYSCCGRNFYLYNEYMKDNIIEIPYDVTQPITIYGNLSVTGNIQYTGSPYSAQVIEFPNFISGIPTSHIPPTRQITTNQSLAIDTGVVNILPNGATGFLSYTVPENGDSYKKFIYYFQNFSYSNSFTNNFLYRFSKIAEVTSNSAAIDTSHDLTSITFYPIAGVVYTGMVIVQGF